jgi:type I restriction enzyme M protein
VVRVLVAMLSPHKGRIYDPCCGSGGMFVQSEKFIEAHGGRTDDVSIYGQESNPTTWRLVAMNLCAGESAVQYLRLVEHEASHVW